jgi:hypothetical protein
MLVRQREARSEAARVYIPEPADIIRREKCLADPERFLKTYFAPIFFNPFADHHKAMISAIYERAFSGGDKAVAAPRGDGKALSLNTKIPTPNGWRTMEDIKPGDLVFGGDGNICNVVAVTDVMHNRPCYEIVFADGQTVIADENHEWVVNKRWKKSQTIATTKEMYLYGVNTAEGKRNWFDAAWTVDVSNSIQIKSNSEKNIIDPYVLGVWLGDGNTDDSMMTCHKSESCHYINEFSKLGLNCGTPKKSTGNAVRFTIGFGSKMTSDRISQYRDGLLLVETGMSVRQASFKTGAEPCRLSKYVKSQSLPPTSLMTMLRQLNLLGNKHIPDAYLFATEESRLALLQGLMDTDGSITKRGQCEYTSKLKHLVDQVSSLVSSLGIKSGNVTSRLINGVPYYRLTFTATEKIVFRLKRKAERQVLTNAKCLKTKAIKSITPVDSVPVKCIQVDSKDRTYLFGDKFTKTHNSQVVIGMVIYVLHASPISFPVLIAGTRSKAVKLFKQVKTKYANKIKYPEFYEDFPEVCYCVSALQGTPQRAAKQHVDGELTGIVWTQDLVSMPYVPGSNVSGKRLTFFGLDSAIRGEGFEEMRPDMAIIDDPETREVAFSPTDKHREVEEMIDGDIAGLSGPTSRMRRVVLTTIQNRRCYSFRVTDRKLKPTFEGDRYPLLSQWPTNRELWDEYLALRQKDQSDGLKDGPTATKFYLDNYDDMREGAIISNPYRFVSETNSDGDEVELDALQSFFNRVADWGLDRVLAELQQDPDDGDEPESMQLTAGAVASRMSGLKQNELPKSDCKVVIGCDLGKYASHWVKLAVYGNAICHVIDYGVIENPGMQSSTPTEAVEVSLVARLEQWRSEHIGDQLDMVLIDSGTFTRAVYDFIKRVGYPFYAAKGQSAKLQFEGKNTKIRKHFEQVRADWQQQEKVWLYNVNVDYWKLQVQQRFKTATFSESHEVNDGSLSLYSTQDRKEHLSFSQHIVAEELQEVFRPGKGVRTEWVVKNKNNHWLDAMTYGLAGTGVLGFRMMREPKPLPKPRQPPKPRMLTPDGRAFLATER